MFYKNVRRVSIDENKSVKVIVIDAGFYRNISFIHCEFVNTSND